MKKAEQKHVDYHEMIEETNATIKSFNDKIDSGELILMSRGQFKNLQNNANVLFNIKHICKVIDEVLPTWYEEDTLVKEGVGSRHLASEKYEKEVVQASLDLLLTRVKRDVSEALNKQIEVRSKAFFNQSNK